MIPHHKSTSSQLQSIRLVETLAALLMQFTLFHHSILLDTHSKLASNIRISYFNPFVHNVVKWSNILQKSCGVHTARFLKYVWPFYNIMHERVNKLPPNFSHTFIKHGLIFTCSNLDINLVSRRFEFSK